MSTYQTWEGSAGALPHIAVYFLILLAYYLPPFQGRGPLFAFLIIAADYASKISGWPSPDGATRPMRYGLASSWFFTLPALERLLLRSPESDFWLLDKAETLGKGRPREFTWRKLGWAFSLAATPRGVGWNFGSRKVNAKRNDMRVRATSRPYFVLYGLVRAILAYIALDTVVFAVSRSTVPVAWAWDLVVLRQIANMELLMAICVYATMTMQFDMAAAFAAAVGFSRPEDWPPLFGSLTDCYTISNVWGSFWHGYIRQPCLGISHALVRKLAIPQKSLFAYAIHLTTAFVISGWFHIWSLSVVAEGYISLFDVTVNFGAFFLAQPIGTMVEATLIHHFQIPTRPRDLQRVKKAYRGLSIESSDEDHVFQRLASRALGYTWVVSWFILTGWWFVVPYSAVGVAKWSPPLSLWTRVSN